MPTKYRMTFKCSCGNTFRHVTLDRDLLSAPCPSCRSKQRKTRFVRMGDGPITDADLIAEKAAQKLRDDPEYQEWLAEKKRNRWGASEQTKNQIKSVDETAKIVMEDYKMGDLKDTVHQGEAAAPKLTPKLQQQADGFFKAGRSRNSGGINTAAIARAAMSGAYAPSRTGAINPVAQQHAAKIRMPTNVIASSNGKA